MRNLLSWIRALLIFWPAVFLLTAALLPVSLLAGVLDKRGGAQHAVVRLWARVALRLLSPSITVTGLENIDATEARLYVANHLSAVDIPLLYCCLPIPFRIMAHTLVFRVPLIGWWLRGSGSLEIAPESVALSRRALRDAIETLRAGKSMVIFPEGERAPKGEMLPFRRGAFYVAVKAQADIVPMAIVGAYGALPLGSAHLRRVPLRLIIGKPISITGYEMKDLERLAQRVQETVRSLAITEAPGAPRHTETMQ